MLSYIITHHKIINTLDAYWDRRSVYEERKGKEASLRVSLERTGSIFGESVKSRVLLKTSPAVQCVYRL